MSVHAYLVRLCVLELAQYYGYGVCINARASEGPCLYVYIRSVMNQTTHKVV